MRRRALTPMEVGAIVAIVLLLVCCCCGYGVLSTFYQPEPPVLPVYPTVYPVPTATY